MEKTIQTRGIKFTTKSGSIFTARILRKTRVQITGTVKEGVATFSFTLLLDKVDNEWTPTEIGAEQLWAHVIKELVEYEETHPNIFQFAEHAARHNLIANKKRK